MSISIQTTNPALAALEAMTGQSSGASAATVASNTVPQALLDPSGDAQSGGDTLDLSGGAAAGALGGLTGGLSTAASLTDAAASAGATIESLLGQMQQAAQIATDPSLSSAQLSQLDAGFKAGLAQIQQALSGATVAGANLIDGSGAPPATGASLTAYNLSLGGPLIGVGADASLSDPSGSANLAVELGQALANVTQVVGQIAAQGQSIEGHLSVIAQAAGALTPGVSGAINPDLDGDGARLQALQVQQTLSGSNSAISNQSPQAILALFAA